MRAARVALWLAWPVGLGLALGHLLGGLLSDPVYAVVDAAYAGGVLLAARRAGLHRDRAGAMLVAAGVLIFALASLSGEPTATRPTALLLNAAALLVAAVLLLLGAVELLLRAGRPALAGVVAIVIGSGAYLLNLLARWAIVLAGAADQQAAVEQRAWVANVYLTGLDGTPGYLTVLLVWLDLMQVAYLVLTYAGFAAIAAALGHRRIAFVGAALAGLVIVASASAGALPGAAGGVAAEIAFVLTIPFMSTLVPGLLGCALLRKRGLLEERTNAIYPEWAATAGD